MGNKNCIEAESLVKRYGEVKVLDGVSFSVPCGGSVALLGPNGAGKTTTLRILAGLLKPDSGRALVCGYDVQWEPRRAKECLGYLPENAEPFLGLTVRENLEYMALLGGLGDGAVDEALRLVGLEDLADRRAYSLSRGEGQMLAIALAVMAVMHKPKDEPKVLLLDEPLNYLDIPAQKRVIDLLKELNSEHGVTLLISTHMPCIVGRLARRVLIINNKGRIAWKGTMTRLRAMAKPGEGIVDVVARLMK